MFEPPCRTNFLKDAISLGREIVQWVELLSANGLLVYVYSVEKSSQQQCWRYGLEPLENCRQCSITRRARLGTALYTVFHWSCRPFSLRVREDGAETLSAAEP